MKIQDCMSRDVHVANPGETIQQAARVMAQLDSGVLPVGDKDKLVGMITDRDIAIRAIAEGKGPDCKVRDVMSSEVKYCFDDQEVEDVLQNMGDIQVRRMPVVNRDKRLVGIVSLSDLTSGDGTARQAGKTLNDISRPSALHSQTG